MLKLYLRTKNSLSEETLPPVKELGISTICNGNICLNVWKYLIRLWIAVTCLLQSNMLMLKSTIVTDLLPDNQKPCFLQTYIQVCLEFVLVFTFLWPHKV